MAYDKHEYATFNATHTWVEYINRLIGALSGLPILALFIFSLIHIKKQPVIAALAAGTLFMLGYEAWLGKLVVDGNLVPNAITKHMFGSMVIVALLITIISRTHQSLKKEVKKTFKFLVVAMLILLSIQILLGTQVREQIDEIAKLTADRKQWIDMLDATILIHRSSSILIFILSIWLFWRNWRNDYAVHAVGLAFLFIFIEIIVGAVMYYIHVPKFLQPVHLLLSIGAFAFLVWALLRTKVIEKEE
jgi:cytochrome c oxidase assembly protein subunit 15